jgi:hypothetical protein
MTRFEVWKRKMNSKPKTHTNMTGIANVLKDHIYEAIERHKNDPPSASQIVMARSEMFM